MVRRLIGGTGALLLVILFILWIGPSRQTQPSEEQSSVTEVEVESSEPIEEEPEPAIPERSVASIAPRQTPVDQNQPSDSQSEQMRKAIELLRPKAAGQVDLLKRAYRKESRDATSQDTERLVREQFGSEQLPAETLQEVTCHKSVCKIEIFWSEQRPTIQAWLTMRIGPLLTGHMAFDPAPEPDSKGRLLVDVYVVRPGFDVANFE
jgi:hypothetical protein